MYRCVIGPKVENMDDEEENSQNAVVSIVTFCDTEMEPLVCGEPIEEECSMLC